jgi:hypothetical protein
MIIGMLASVLAFGSIADACHGTRHARGVSGTIRSVGKNTLSLSVPSGNGTSVMTVKVAKGTRIMGSSGHVLSGSLLGHTATVVGTTEGRSIRASEIVVNG